MLQIQTIRENPTEVIERLSVKNFDAKEIIQNILSLDTQIRQLKKTLDENLMVQVKIAKTIGTLYKEGKRAEADELKQKTAELKNSEKEMQSELSEKDVQITDLMVLMPNMPHASVPRGKSAEDNEVIYEEGDASNFTYDALPHWELVKKYDIIDFELGCKITGAGFPVYKGKGARMQRALINFFLNSASEQGYTEIQPPYMVNENSAYATGQLPDKEGQMYHANLDNFYLIPTAEVPVTNIYRDVILQPSDFPVKMTAYTPCWRREAGSYGKDVRGLNRLHQFDKVEIVRLELPDNSYRALDDMIAHVEVLVQELGLPYRILRLCGGDMSFTSAITYDFEVFSAAQQRWLEVSSVSNFETFQANRLKLRYRTADKKTQLAHTLNGSSLALPRILAALIENNQDEQGHVRIPKVLQQYTGFAFI